MPRYIAVAEKSRIPDNGVLCVEAEGKRIALFKLEGEIYALDDACPHEGGPLSEGLIEGGAVECPWHQSRFDIKTGRVLLDPAETDVRRYPVRVQGDSVEVEI